MDLMDVSLSELREMVMNREAWHAVIHGVAKSRTRLSNSTELMIGVQFHACHYLFFYRHLLKRDPFPTEYFWLPCQLFIDYICEGLFLVSLFCSIVICMFLMLVPCCFDYCSSVIYFDTKCVMCLALFFLFKIALAIQHLLCFHLHFKVGNFHGNPVVKTLSFQCM